LRVERDVTIEREREREREREKEIRRKKRVGKVENNLMKQRVSNREEGKDRMRNSNYNREKNKREQ